MRALVGSEQEQKQHQKQNRYEGKINTFRGCALVSPEYPLTGTIRL